MKMHGMINWLIAADSTNKTVDLITASTVCEISKLNNLSVLN